MHFWGGDAWSLSTLKAGDLQGCRYLRCSSVQSLGFPLAVPNCTMSKPRDYSSQSYSPGSTAPLKSHPGQNGMDPSGKSRERDDMVGLNDKFVRLIDKMKHLEDENKKLDTKLKILREHEDYEGKIADIVKQLENEMEQQIETLLHDREKLHAALLKNQEEVEDTKKRYEEEFQKKSELENEFIVKKKEVDVGHLEAVDLVLDLEDLIGKLDFLRAGYDEEIKELESHVQNVTVVLRDNSKRSLDMDEIIEGVKNQYAHMAPPAPGTKPSSGTRKRWMTWS
ncbi:hypothetical protein FQN60_006856 [Etheostoma spectabile]|uniref:Keratin, type II cytoskeletal 8 n=1 Tax=Etheostoma spectabile TaxID=54343 RepID=A0A5J5CFF1_9PERO|nr:hypothetical protein FQN60_006856 [Etheostoma spectabile]